MMLLLILAELAQRHKMVGKKTKLLEIGKPCARGSMSTILLSA